MYSGEILTAESIIRRIVNEELDEGERSCHPKEFDCPFCKRITISKTIPVKTETGIKSSRYCYICGKTFLKKITWEKEDAKK